MLPRFAGGTFKITKTKQKYTYNFNIPSFAVEIIPYKKYKYASDDHCLEGKKCITVNFNLTALFILRT